MKVAVYQKNPEVGEYKLYQPSLHDTDQPTRCWGETSGFEVFVGYIELPIEKPNTVTVNFSNGVFTRCFANGVEHEFEIELADGGMLRVKLGNPKKKLVTKEAEPVNITEGRGWITKFYEFQVPVNAQNVKCTYEIEE